MNRRFLNIFSLFLSIISLLFIATVILGEIINNERLVLRILINDTGKTYTCNVNTGDKIVLHYTNSLYMKNVYEIFEVGLTQEFILQEIIFGNNSHTKIELRDLEDSYMNAESFIIEGLNFRFKNITIRVGEIGQPTLVTDTCKFDLYDLAGFGGQVTIFLDYN